MPEADPFASLGLETPSPELEAGLTDALVRLESARKSGLIGSLHRAFSFSDEPRFWQYCSLPPGAGLDTNPESTATSRFELEAKVKALGECLERVSLALGKTPLIQGSFRDLGPSGALDPASFLAFDEAVLGCTRASHVDVIRSAELGWIRGTRLVDGAPSLIPAQCVFVPYPRDEPPICPHISTGAACHPDLRESTMVGLLECLERDSFMLQYLAQLPSPVVSLEGPLSHIAAYFRRYHLEPRVHSLTAGGFVPTFACVLIDRSGMGPAISVGLSAGRSPDAAIEKSMLEAQQIRQWTRFSHDSEAHGTSARGPNADPLVRRGLHWYTIDMIQELDFLVGPPVGVCDIPICHWELDDLVSELASHGLLAYRVDLTPPAAATAGLSVVKAVVPGLHPLYLDESMPCRVTERLNGLLSGRAPNPIPHPFM